jgi:integrase
MKGESFEFKRAGKELSHEEFFKLFKGFIHASENGTRTKKNGDHIKRSTIEGYHHCQRLVSEFCLEKGWRMKLHLTAKLNGRELREAQMYWRNFYKQFTDYLYFDLNHFDNYVGQVIKCLRVFFNYLNDIQMLNIGRFHAQFHVAKEDIEIVTLTPSQLNRLIDESSEQKKIRNKMDAVLDIFVLGCTVGLRFGDLMNLKRHHLSVEADGWLLSVQSQKTGVVTKIRLPQYAIQIFERYKSRKRELLPQMSKGYFNACLKRLAIKIFGSSVVSKSRSKRGVREIVLRHSQSRREYHINELVSSHMMRRTAITVMLRLGMSESAVRAISGHAPNSKEFYKYVAYCQNIQNEETDRMFAKLQNS